MANSLRILSMMLSLLMGPLICAVFSRQRATHRLTKPFLAGIYRPFAGVMTEAAICNGFLHVR